MNRTKSWLIILSLIITNLVQGQKLKKLAIEVQQPICYASDKVEKSFIPPPSYLNLKSNAEKKSEIIVEYSLFPPEAIDAFDYAVNIWEHIIESDIPIYIEANWRPQGQNTLGSAGPTAYYTNFKNIPHENRYYPVAIVEKITKTEITGPQSPDITATFNEDIDWYFKTDGETPELMYDFVTVVLHEITHGLGFTGFFFMDGNDGIYGYNNFGDAAAFDLLVVNSSEEQLVDTLVYELYSSDLGDALKSNSLYAMSPSAMAANSGNKPRLYTPSSFDDGSSIYHLNDLTYPSGTENALMTHAIGAGEANHNPGPITSGIMSDIGWNHMYLNVDKPKDIETVQPITFNVSIESDNRLNKSAFFVVYSYDNFINHTDSLLLTSSDSLNLYSATLTPAIEDGTIYYYITVQDFLARVFNEPTEAPAKVNKVTIGPDSEPPVIDHIPIPYFLLINDNLLLTANVDDNLGVDTVYVEYEINGISQQHFGLTFDSTFTYSGSFNFDLEQLKDGDEITYTITAIDSAIASNSITIPLNDKFIFKVEKTFDPISKYVNDFNKSTTDFILSDFSIYTETNFENAALHSQHPYTSPEKSNTNFNFTTILKHPIILQESGTMTFDEIVLVEPGEFLSKFGDDDFWDYVIIEGSKDFGETWLQLANGYDSGANTVWKTNYNAEIIVNTSQAVGTPELYASRVINLAGSNFTVGDTLLIRFRLFSDPFANGWGWAIDNLRIQVPVSSTTTTLSPGNIMVYPNPFNSIINVVVQANKKVDVLDFEVFNTFGQKIQIQQNKNVIGEISHKFNLGAYADGMYFISVKENGKQVYSRKILKK